MLSKTNHPWEDKYLTFSLLRLKKENTWKEKMDVSKRKEISSRQETALQSNGGGHDQNSV